MSSSVVSLHILPPKCRCLDHQCYFCHVSLLSKVWPFFPLIFLLNTDSNCSQQLPPLPYTGSPCTPGAQSLSLCFFALDAHSCLMGTLTLLPLLPIFPSWRDFLDSVETPHLLEDLLLAFFLHNTHCVAAVEKIFSLLERYRSQKQGATSPGGL